MRKTSVITAGVLAFGASLATFSAAQAQGPVPRADPPLRLQPRPVGQVLKIPKITLSPAAVERIWVGKFTAAFMARCADHAVGCAVAAIGSSGVTSEAADGAARRAPDFAPRAMTAGDVITMASVSKTFTAATLLKIISDKKVIVNGKPTAISVDDKIAPYLPKSWTLSEPAKTLTFRQLLRHQSGLECGGISYAQLKTCFATTKLDGAKTYHNENFAVMRMIIPIMYGSPVRVNMTDMLAKEAAGDPGPIAAYYGARYRSIVNTVVFSKAGLPTLECKVQGRAPALSYKSATTHKWDFSSVLPGESWGDMSDYCGSQGWFMSARQMAAAMRAINTPGLVMPAAALTQMQGEQLGVYASGDLGKGVSSWSHGGYHPAEWNKGEINTIIVHFSNGVSAGVIVNSPYKGATVDAGGDLWGDLVQAALTAGP